MELFLKLYQAEHVYFSTQQHVRIYRVKPEFRTWALRLDLRGLAVTLGSINIQVRTCFQVA